MRISATIFVILISTYIVNSSVLDPVIENVVHLKASTPPSGVPGIWKKKTIWKPRWVKEWKSAKVMKPVWRKVWSPVQIREWVPIPKPPPGWGSVSTKLVPVHPKPQKEPLKDSLSHDSYTVHSKVPLWDPVPYPESQQPPPPPIPQSLYHMNDPCGKDGCDNAPSQTFNHQQISEIIGTRYQTQDYYQSPEYSETVNIPARLPPDGNWRPPQPLSDGQSDTRFHNFQGLPEFLIPPRYSTAKDFHQLANPPNTNILVTRSPGFEIPNTLPQWTPLPPIKGHFVTKASDQPVKFHFPEVELRQNNTLKVFQSLEKTALRKPNFQTHNTSSSFHLKGDRDFIQQAELVGEYHYSVFDESTFKPEPPSPPPPLPSPPPQKEQVKVKLPKHPVEDKQTRPENKLKIQNDLNNAHVQKKHIPNFQQEVLIKEIFPTHKIPEIPKPTTGKPLPVNANFTKPTASIKPSTETYPIYEIPRKVNPVFVPPQHRFSQPSTTNTTKLLPVTTDKESEIENSPNDKNNRVQIVFATTPLDYQSTERLQRTTTTEPYEIIFASSLQSTTEAVTKSPVIVVTPANPNTS